MITDHDVRNASIESGRDAARHLKSISWNLALIAGELKRIADHQQNGWPPARESRA
jgi:hypothetical protein